MAWLRAQPLFVQVLIWVAALDLLKRHVLDSAMLAAFVRGLFG